MNMLSEESRERLENKIKEFRNKAIIAGFAGVASFGGAAGLWIYNDYKYNNYISTIQQEIEQLCLKNKDLSSEETINTHFVAIKNKEEFIQKEYNPHTTRKIPIGFLWRFGPIVAIIASTEYLLRKDDASKAIELGGEYTQAFTDYMNEKYPNWYKKFYRDAEVNWKKKEPRCPDEN